ncbi:centrosomal protein of 112 kDa-like [Anthonomus grandis grandis]|uniref:centrosomal protein of 112 kDa-like n=1 Tax=Anthonomus grandis grandis TaxID=2921223 RepID=UPI0021662910|nr:centrosomal protein of 112 kDa-like [Anthonomus grandis grandis]
MDPRTNLDIEFKELLCIIRQYIPRINSNAYLMQCRVWLEKLSTTTANKECRNVYLAELSRQIQANKLLPPFNEAPPTGDLKNLTRFLGKESVSRRSSASSKSKDSYSSSKNSRRQDKGDLLSDLDINLSSLDNETWGYIGDIPKSEDEIMEVSHNLLKNLTSQIGAKSAREGNLVGSGEPSKKNNEIPSDESWSDVSDNTIDPKEEIYIKKKKSTDTKLIKKKHSGNKLKPDSPFASDSSNVNLEQCLGGFLKDTDLINYISQDWKKTIAALQLRLSEMIQQNNTLNEIIQKLEGQLKDSSAKNQAQIEHNLKMAEKLHNEEVSQLKEAHANKLFQIETSNKETTESLTKNYEEKLTQLTYSYEEKIADINKQNEESELRKNNEICRLSEIIQDQCLRIMNDISSLKTQISNCSCEKKVHVLKKCVSKMDKLFQKTEKDYIKQIEQLKQELELKEGSLQVQLKLQKAELITQTKTDQKEHFEEILNSLEVKYIKMLEGHELQIMKAREEDVEKIKYLTYLLDKNGIPYNDKIECQNNKVL